MARRSVPRALRCGAFLPVEEKMTTSRGPLSAASVAGTTKLQFISSRMPGYSSLPSPSWTYSPCKPWLLILPTTSC